MISDAVYLDNKSHLLDKCLHFQLKLHPDKINFIKGNGICFGCSKVGNTRKDCGGRLNCNVCHQKHPSVLHIEEKDKGTSFKEVRNL